MKKSLETAGRGKVLYLPTKCGYVKKRESNGVYYLVKKINGVFHRESLDTTVPSIAQVKADARLQELKVEAKNSLRANVQKGKISIGQLYQLWRADAVKGKKQNTASGYDFTFSKLCRVWGSFDGDVFDSGFASEDSRRISRAALEDLLAREIPNPALTNSELSPGEKQNLSQTVCAFRSRSAKSQAIALIKNLFRFAQGAGFRHDNPVAQIKGVSRRKSDKTKIVPSEEQFSVLINYIRDVRPVPHKQHVLDLIEFFTWFGTRKSETSRLLKSYVHLEPFCPGELEIGEKIGEIRIPDSIVKGRKGKEKGRILPILPQARNLIKRLLSQTITITKVTRGKIVSRGPEYLHPVKEIDGVLRNACRALIAEGKLPNGHIYSHHTFRHLFATRWVEIMGEWKILSETLGHSDGGSLAFETYSHVRSDHRSNEFKRFATNLHSKSKGAVPTTVESTSGSSNDLSQKFWDAVKRGEIALPDSLKNELLLSLKEKVVPLATAA